MYGFRVGSFGFARGGFWGFGFVHGRSALLAGAGSMSVVEFELRPRLGRLRLFEISRLGFAFFRINVGAGPCIEALQRGASRQNTRVC